MTEDGQKSTDLWVDPKKKYGEDCVVPKKPLSSYLFYTKENVNRLKEEKGCTHPEAMKFCGDNWVRLDDEGKKKYHELHDKDVIRYEKQVKDLDRNGFFMMDDGSKSSDHKAVIKKKKKDKIAEKAAKAEKKAKHSEKEAAVPQTETPATEISDGQRPDHALDRAVLVHFRRLFT